MLNARGHQDRSCQFTECHSGPARWVCLRDHHYKYVHLFTNGYEELYDLQEDPNELHNLTVEGTTDTQQQVRSEFRQRLIEWERIHGPEPISDDLPNLGMDDWFGKRHNRQLPTWCDNVVDPAERAAINSVEQEVLEVLANEPDVDLADLDLQWWVENGGSAELRDRVLRGDYPKPKSHLSGADLTPPAETRSTVD